MCAKVIVLPWIATVSLKVRLIVSLLLATRVVILVLSLTVAVSVSVTLSVSLTVLCLTVSFGLAVRTAGGGQTAGQYFTSRGQYFTSRGQYFTPACGGLEEYYVFNVAIPLEVE